jgi:hypothetical protein
MPQIKGIKNKKVIKSTAEILVLSKLKDYKEHSEA